MASRLPPLIIGALLACAVVASAEKPTPTPGPLTEEQVRQTLERIVIPKLELRDASLREALDFLSKEAQRLDPKKRGIPFHVRIEPPIPAASMVPGIPGTLTPAPAPANPESLLNPDDAKITVSLTNISLSEALRYVTGLANLKFRIRPDGVHIVSLQDPEPMFTRDLRIPADFFSASEKQDRIDHSDLVAMIKKDFRQFLIANGVRFDEPAAAILDDRGKRLTVHNTKDQIELIETILRTPTASPTALEIESKKRDAQERASKAAIRRKMETIVLHEISLVNVSLKSAVETLKKLSWKHDRRSPAKVRGVNLILRNPEDEAPKTADSVSEILGLSAPPAAPVNSTPTPLPTEPLITYSATKVTVQQAVTAIAGQAGYHVNVQPYAVCIQKPAPPEELFTREWKIPPEAIPSYRPPQTEEEKRSGIADRESVKNWLTGSSPNFSDSPKSSVYIVSSSRLIVRDTEEKLREIDEKIDAYWREHDAAEKAKKKSR